MNSTKNTTHLFYLLGAINESMAEYIQSKSEYLVEKTKEVIYYYLINKPLILEEFKIDLIRYNLDKKELLYLIQWLEDQILLSKSSKTELYYQLSKLITQSASFDHFYQYFESELSKEKILYPSRYIYDYHYNYKQIILPKKSADLSKNLSLLENYIFHAYSSILYFKVDAILYNTEEEASQLYFESLNDLMINFKIEKIELIILQQCIGLINTKDKSLFFDIISKLESEKIMMRPTDIKMIFNILIAVCYNCFTTWGSNYNIIIDVFKSMFIHYNTLFYSNIEPHMIVNIATLSIRCNDLAWFNEVFNASEIKKLNLNCQKTLELCRAKFVFHSKKYEDCITILNQFKTIDIFQELELRRLQIMCFYELHQRVLVDNYLNTFKVFIHRNDTINKTYKESNNNFIRCLNRLNKSVDSKKVDTILNEIKLFDRVAEKQWVQTKCEDLKLKITKV